MGGGSSHDKEYRTEGENWWKEELPSQDEYKKEITNLGKNDFKVDYVLTNCEPTSVQKAISSTYDINKLTDFLEDVKNITNYEKWFVGHYHKDLKIGGNFVAVFDKIIEV